MLPMPDAKNKWDGISERARRRKRDLYKPEHTHTNTYKSTLKVKQTKLLRATPYVVCLNVAQTKIHINHDEQWSIETRPIFGWAKNKYASGDG